MLVLNYQHLIKHLIILEECFFFQLPPDNNLRLLEDLSDYRVGDQVEGATFEESGLALEELAKLHGTFWGEVNSDEFDWMPRFSNSWNATNMLEGSQASWEQAAQNFDEHMPQWIRDIKEDYFQALPELQKHLDKEPVTVLHGDFRLDNLFFGKEPHHHKMTFIDWQGPVRGRGPVEIAFLLAQSTKIEERRAHEKELIQRYLDSLQAQGVSEYSFDEAWEDFRVSNKLTTDEMLELCSFSKGTVEAIEQTAQKM